MFKRFLAITLLLVFAGSGALADATLVDKFYDTSGTSVVFVMTLNTSAANPEKAASVGIKYQHTDDHYKFDGTYVDLIVVFDNTSDWQKFVSMWTKARAAREKTDAGDYFADNTILSVTAESDGGITFTMAGNPGANNQPKDMDVFFLQPKDFAAFDETVKKVSAYFEN